MILSFSSYSAKITALFLVIGLFPIIGISYFLYTEEIVILQNSLEFTLTTQSENTSTLISKWITERGNTIIGIASNKILVSKTNVLLNSDSFDVYNANFELQTQSSIYLDNNPWLTEYVISDPNGKILFFTGNRMPKENFSSQDHFMSALQGKLGISDISKSQDIIKNEYGFYELFVPTMWISYPIMGEVGIHGILTARIDVFSIPHWTDTKTDYNSLDVYLVNSNGYFISKPKFFDFDDDTIKRPELNSLITDPNSNSFTQIFNLINNDQTQLAQDYNNYVGKSVTGSITPVENTNWFVISEINKDESNSKIFSTQIILFVLISLSILVIIGASIFLSSKTAEPIKNLKLALKVVSTGNFDVKLKPKGNDEITFLFESFNSMTDSLKNANNRILSTELKYKQLYDNAPDMYRTIDTSGTILDCNLVYAQTLGYAKDEIIGKSIFDHVDKNSIEILQDTFSTWKKIGYVKNREIWMKRKDNSIFPAMLNVASIYDEQGKIIGSNTSIRDITELHNAQKKIESDQHLIQKQFEDLKQIDKLKDEFLAMITHELRTPLVPIKAYVEMLLTQSFGPLNQKQQEKLKIIESSSESMLKLIKDLLDAQTIELGRLRLDKNVYDLSEIIKNVVMRLKLDADVYDISLTQELNDGILCLCDKSRIEQVLVNLISNSLDFCPKQTGKIQIKLNHEGNFAKILVKDNGIGIIKESLDKIFVKFYQVNTSNTREHGGTGLGLSVCKGIIENHGGKIWAESEGRDKGAEIHILLPLNSHKS
ncbi:MAG: ATP-binding protein [Nitrosarchaeum sp.]